MPEMQDTVCHLMASLAQGDTQAANQLTVIFHRELHRLAVSKMRYENQGHTWQPTALVNELYLTLTKIRKLESHPNQGSDDRQAFLALAARIMSRLLISHARTRRNELKQIELEAVDIGSYEVASLGELENILGKLAQLDPKLRSVVELKVFAGLTGTEIADQLQVSPRSVARYWDFARVWLQEAFQKSSPRSL